MPFPFKVVDLAKAFMRPRNIKSELAEYAIRAGERPAAPSILHRGVPEAAYAEREGAAYAHATPLYDVAEKSGKFFDDYGTVVKQQLVEDPAAQKYYRGGSLEGDPLEETRIGSVKGITWDDALTRYQDLFDTQLQKRLKENKRFKYEEPEEASKKAVFDATWGDFRNAVFETDLSNKPGKWADATALPRGFETARPPLRTNKSIDAFDKKHKPKGGK